MSGSPAHLLARQRCHSGAHDARTITAVALVPCFLFMGLVLRDRNAGLRSRQPLPHIPSCAQAGRLHQAPEKLAQHHDATSREPRAHTCLG
eukprot:8910176-Heterocapsa_arctica.AAC.1